MPVNSAAMGSVTLEGAWSLERAADLLKLLAELLEAGPRPEETKIDMTGVVELDACGCQLLALFLEKLRRRGITPIICGIPEQARDQIELLGFSEAFAAPEKRTGNLHD